uniref:Uncharacterized protein n=1 Tax=Ciona intestinalis TaxID=7719 RepID=H2XWR0_CIOIN
MSFEIISGYSYWYATMSDNNVAVFPVPDGISRTPCPFASNVRFNSSI